MTVARAMYHQRSGTTLEAPYTAVNRPRPYHPEDGVVVVQSKNTLMENGNGLDDQADRFAELGKDASTTAVAEAWGGHFDAGDWDRRIQHLHYMQSAIDLVELFPEVFAELNLDIPESGNKIPDVLDEGLWDLDLYRRLQLPDGSIRGGIEADDHPIEHQTSWTQQQPTYVYAPDPYATYIYAAVAAQAAQVLQKYDQALSDTYRASSLAAMKWAQAQKIPAPFTEQIDTLRAVAAAALYRLTADTQWQDVFVAMSTLDDGPLDLLGCHGYDLCNSTWIYARTDHATVRADVKRNAVESFRRNADALVAGQDTTAFGWTIEHPYIPLVWGLGPSIPKVIGLARAYELLGDKRWCSAAVRSASFAGGANPMDMTFVTGLGQRNPRTPLVVDSLEDGIPFWPGTPVFGLHTMTKGSDDWIDQYFLRPDTIPTADQTPYLHSWYGLSNVAPMSEFTVFQSHAVALFGFGYLAAQSC